MNITKKNGVVVLYDTKKIKESILKANAEAPLEEMTPQMASYLANEVFSRLTSKNEILTTQEIREGVYQILIESGMLQTAECYMSYKKQP